MLTVHVTVNWSFAISDTKSIEAAANMLLSLFEIGDQCSPVQFTVADSLAVHCFSTLYAVLFMAVAGSPEALASPEPVISLGSLVHVSFGAASALREMSSVAFIGVVALFHPKMFLMYVLPMVMIALGVVKL